MWLYIKNKWNYSIVLKVVFLCFCQLELFSLTGKSLKKHHTKGRKKSLSNEIIISVHINLQGGHKMSLCSHRFFLTLKVNLISPSKLYLWCYNTPTLLLTGNFQPQKGVNWLETKTPPYGIPPCLMKQQSYFNIKTQHRLSLKMTGVIGSRVQDRIYGTTKHMSKKKNFDETETEHHCLFLLLKYDCIYIQKNIISASCCSQQVWAHTKKPWGGWFPLLRWVLALTGHRQHPQRTSHEAHKHVPHQSARKRQNDTSIFFMFLPQYF